MKKLISIALALTICTLFVSCRSSDIKNAQELINALPDTYTSDAEQAFNDAKAAYDALPEEDKHSIDITKMETLESAKKASDIMEIVKKLPSKLTDFSDFQKFYDGIMEIKDIGVPNDTIKYLDVDKLIDAAGVLMDYHDKIGEETRKLTESVSLEDSSTEELKAAQEKVEAIMKKYLGTDENGSKGFDNMYEEATDVLYSIIKKF